MPVTAEWQQLPVAEARAGNADAWETLFRRYRLPLYAYAFEMLGNEQAALDVVQETFLNAFRHIQTLRDDARFGSWLFSIAHQKCLQQWRRYDRDAAIREELEHATAGDVEAEELLIREEQEEHVMKLLQQLPAAQRAALVLHYVEGFPLEVIARITGAELGTVKSRLHYARRALKRLLLETAS